MSDPFCDRESLEQYVTEHGMPPADSADDGGFWLCVTEFWLLNEAEAIMGHHGTGYGKGTAKTPKGWKKR